MNTKRYLGASIAVFICFQILEFIIHGPLLGKVYMSMEGVWRPDMMSKMWIIYTTSFILSFLFVYIFTKGYEGKGIGEGFRYGLLIGLLMNVVGMFNQYAVYPIPFVLALQWFIYGMIEFSICGIVAAMIYKPKEAS